MTIAQSQIQTTRLSRRQFLVQSGALSCGIMFGQDALAQTTKAQTGQTVTPNTWVTLHADGAIDVICPGIELGQGAFSTLPRFVAEELDADWNHVRVIPAPADQKTYGNPLFWGLQITAGSRTCLGYFNVLRLAGAQARYILVTAAAQKWRVPLEELSTSNSIVTHAKTNRRATYGELVRLAQVPAKLPDFVAPDDRPQPTDVSFGPPPPSPLAPSPEKANAIRLKSPHQYKLLGGDVPRRDIPEKVSGTARYGIDMHVPGMVYAMVETGPIQGGTPEQIDDAATRAIPGIIDVIRLPYGVAVVGTDIFSVRKARTLLKITWGSQAKARDYDSAATLDDFSRIAGDLKQPGVRVWEPKEKGATEAALADPGATGQVIAFEARSNLIYHAPIEPQNAIVQIAEDGKSADVWVGTQWPRLDQQYVSKILDTAPESIRIHTLYPGGSFGRRQEPGAIIDATHLAQKLRKPVKVIWTREDDIKRNPYRQAMVCRVDAAVNADGRITAMRHRIVADSWFARVFPDWYERGRKADPGNWTGAVSLYDIPWQAVDCITERRGVDVCYMRGVGATQTKFAQECLIDLVAERQKQDPLQFRLRLLQAEPRAIEVLQTVARMAEWTRARSDRALGLAYTPSADGHVATIAEVSVNRSSGEIRVHNVWSAVDVGFAAQPDIIASQIEGGILQGMSIALLEKVVLKQGEIQGENFDAYPILRMSQTPQVTVKVISTEHAMAGAAEIGILQIAPAINNALAKLIGTRLSDLPMTPELVLAALRKTPT